MAMHKKLDVGSILFTYPEAIYHANQHRNGQDKYRIEFNVLYVHNRRERTTGAYISETLVPTLDKLGIRHAEAGQGKVYAVGCRNAVYYSTWSAMPYPSAEHIKEAHAQFEEQLARDTFHNLVIPLVEIEFIQDFKEKKSSNKDFLFSLQQPLEHYLEKELVVN